MKIVVLAGGISTERDVSMSSGAKVAAALHAKGHKVVLADAFFGLPEIPSDIFDQGGKIAPPAIGEQAPDIEAIRAKRGESGFGDIGENIIPLCKMADIVYLGLHGEDGENGKMQALFDIMGIRYTGTGYLGSAMAMNKWVTKQTFWQNHIPTAPGKVIRKGQPLEGADSFGFPCVVKPCSGGSSIGVAVAYSREELLKAIEDTFAYEDEVLVEQFVKGREFSVGILDGEALPPIEICPKGGIYDYAHKYQPGWTEETCPANITQAQDRALREAARGVFQGLRLEVYGRVDFIMTEEGGLYCLEANTLPGMTPTSLLPQEAAADGIGYEELCDKIVRLSLKKYEA